MSLQSHRASSAQVGWLRNALGFVARRGEYIALALLIVVVSIISVAWNIQDTRPMPKQDAHDYLIKTLQFVDRLDQHGGARFWQALADLDLRGRPPAYQLLSVPFVWLFGRSTDGAVSVNILFQALLLLATYGIAKVVKNGRAGLLAALIVAAYPPILNLSRIYMPHYAVVACVALSVWLLLLLVKTRSPKVAWLFGASLGFGALVRHHFPVFYLGIPTIVFGFYMLLFQTEPRLPSSFGELPGWLRHKLSDRFFLRGLLPAGLIAVGLSAAWYLTEGRQLLPIVEGVMEWDVVMTGGFPDVAPSFWWYALTTPGAISNVFAVLLALGLLMAMIKQRVHTSVLAFTFVAGYFSLSLMNTRIWVQFASLLPVAAALTAIWIVEIADLADPTRAGGWRTVRLSKADRQKGQMVVSQVDGTTFTLRLPPGDALWDSIELDTLLRITRQEEQAAKTRYIVRLARERSAGRLTSAALTVVCVIVAVFVFSVVTWGTQSWSRPVAVALGAPLDTTTCSERFILAFCPNPAADSDWHLRDILEIVVGDPACSSRECKLMVVSVNQEFDASAFKVVLMQDFPEHPVEVGRPGGKFGNQPYNFILLLESDYVAYQLLEPGERCRGGNRRTCTIEFLQSPSAIFADTHQDVASFLLPLGRTAVLIKRTRSLTYEEAVQSIEALQMPEHEKSQLLTEVEGLPLSY